MLFFHGDLQTIGASQVAPVVVKNWLVNSGDLRDVREVGSIPRLGGNPWQRAWQPTPVFLSGESHGQRSPATVHGIAESQA